MRVKYFREFLVDCLDFGNDCRWRKTSSHERECVKCGERVDVIAAVQMYRCECATDKSCIKVRKFSAQASSANRYSRWYNCSYIKIILPIHRLLVGFQPTFSFFFKFSCESVEKYLARVRVNITKPETRGCAHAKKTSLQ